MPVLFGSGPGRLPIKEEKMPEHVDDAIASWQDSEENHLRYSGLTDQIPGGGFVDLTAPRAQEESYVGDFVPDGEHDEWSSTDQAIDAGAEPPYA